MSRRMLERDYYLEDVTKQYYPDTSVKQLVEKLYRGYIPSNGSLFTKEELDGFSNVLREANKKKLAVLTPFLIAIIFYKRIPGLKELPSWRWRLPISLALLYLPISLCFDQFDSKHIMLAEEICSKKSKKFRRYQMSGDIRKINPKVQLVELP